MESLVEIIIRHRGIDFIKQCAQNESLEIKKASFAILNLVLQSDNSSIVTSLQSEVRANDFIRFCLDQIQNYPDDQIDEEVMLACAEFIQHSVTSNRKNNDYVMSKDGLQKVVLQLIIVLEELTQNAESLEKDLLLVQVKMLEKLSLAVTNLVQDNIVA